MMRMMLPLFSALLLLFANAAWADGKPSRAAQKGCKWEQLSDSNLGLEAWIQQCDFGFRKVTLYVKGNALMQHFSDGGGADDKLIETFSRQEKETPEAAVKRVFAEHTPDKSLVARCRLEPYRDEDPHAPRAPAGVKRYTFQPNAALKKELDAKQDPGDIPEPPCGEWGYAPDGIQYFEVQGDAHKILFVRVGQDEPPFDERTLQVISPAL